MKISIRTIAAATVAAVGLTVGGIAISNAAVKPDCKNLMYPLCARSVAAGQVVDNSLPGYKKLSPGSVSEDRLSKPVQDKLNKTVTDTDENGKADQGWALKEPVNIAKVGGRFADNATVVGKFTLPKGTWLVNLSGKFNRANASAEGAPEVQPMLQLLAEGNEYGTIGGSDIGDQKDADLFGSTVKLVKLRADTEITVYAFGYNEARSAVGSGDINVVAAEVDVVRAG